MSESKPLTRVEIENMRIAPAGTMERAFLATIDQRDQGVADMTLALLANEAEVKRLQETVDADRQWYPFEQDQDVVLCVEETADGAAWHAVFRDRGDAESWLDSHVVHPEEDGIQLDLMEGRMAGLKLWNSYEPMPRTSLPADVIRSLRVAAKLMCILDGAQAPDDTACAMVCSTCSARRAARAALRAAGIEVHP